MTYKIRTAAALFGAVTLIGLTATAHAAPGDGQTRTWTGQRDGATAGTRDRQRTGGTVREPRGTPQPVVVTPPRPPVVVVKRPEPAPVQSGHGRAHNDHRGHAPVYSEPARGHDSYYYRGRHVERRVEADHDRPHRRHRRHWLRRWW